MPGQAASAPRRARLLVVRGRVAQAVALWLVVVDPQLGAALVQHALDPLQRGQRLLAVDVHRGNALVVPVVTEVHGVVFGRRTSSDWCPGVWPGVDRMVTLPSPNTSWSPASLVIVADGPNAGLLGPAIAQSYSAPWISTVEDANSATLPT